MIYEYKCEYCGKEIEIEQKINEKPPVCYHDANGAIMVSGDLDDPKGARPMKKLISKSSFVLKGGTWAKDNYSRKSK